MSRPRQSVTIYSTDVAAVERVAALLPGLTPHHVALRAMRLGLPAVERELREAARSLVNTDAEGL